MAERRWHYAVALERAKVGWRVIYRLEHKSRGEADKASLSLMVRYPDTAALTLPREIEEGDILASAELKR